MDNTTVGLYDSDGNTIISYDQFSLSTMQHLYVATGWGSDGNWDISYGSCLPELNTTTTACILIFNYFISFIDAIVSVG